MADRLLGGLTPAKFLARHWQKRPLLVRGAFPDFVDPLTPDELAGLALEPDAQARLVLEKGGRRPWQVEHGPFTESRLRALGRSHWSLLVSNVDRRVEAAALILERFAFIPHWRCDDLMVSFAPPSGTVGPHVDSYDVFLIQGRGRRRWGIAERFAPELRPGLDLKILRRFVPEHEWVLETGDMLYLPPGVAHCGVALEDCLTYSVGFRAPARADLLSDLYNLPLVLADKLRAEAGDELYADPDLAAAANPGEVTRAALGRVRDLVRRPLDEDEILGRWFATYVTRPAPVVGGAPAPRQRRRPSPERLMARLRGPRPVWRDDGTRVAFFAGQSQLFLSVDGEELALDLRLRPLVEQVCSARCQSGRDLVRALPRGRLAASGQALLAELFARGLLYQD